MMLTLLAYAMIIAFLFLLTKRKLSVFTALILVPVVFGIAACLLLDKDLLLIFAWIKNGLFYTVNPATKAVKMGVMSGLVLILFAVLYFGIMLKAGLFDPLCIFFIKKAKGDPLKVALATVMVASMVTLDGDTTTTIVVCTAAFIPLFKRMQMKLSYLAILITMPIGIFNQLPWGGPLVACSIALGVEMGPLFTQILPGMLAVNYSILEQKELVNNCASDVLMPSLATFAAGAFTGILGSSGMSTAIANSIISIIPQSLGVHMAPFYAVIAAPAICFLPQDAFYFGIASIVAPVAAQMGITPEQHAVSSMVGQAFRLASPVIPALYLLCERTDMNFVEYQKLFFSWTWPVLLIYLFMHTLTGVMPF